MTKEDPADAHEERNMWNQIVNDLKRLKVIHARATEVSNAIVEMESRFDGSQYFFWYPDSISLFIRFLRLVSVYPVRFLLPGFEISRCSNLRFRCIRKSVTLPELCWLLISQQITIKNVALVILIGWSMLLTWIPTLTVVVQRRL
jgi:hypothetical protein